jgi:trans-2,3-dihydro-3-hydroxyanthranilate isomerase
MRRIRYVLCDVFTDRPLTGNPLAVFTGADGLDAWAMQALAREMNLSESVFLWRPQAGGHMKLRIFTPKHELPFAGHPILGAAFVIGDSVQLDTLRLETGRGIVPVHLRREGPRPVFGWMEQPLPRVERVDDPAPLLSALGVERAVLPVEVYDNGPKHAFVMLGSASAVAGLRPDLGRLAALPCSVNAFAGRDGEYVTRNFSPSDGVAEDPATGSAAGPLALHLVRHGRQRFGDELRIEQGEAVHRPSVLYARIHGDDDRVTRVEVGGAAVIVGRGELYLPL